MVDRESIPHYKGRFITISASHSGNSGPFKASFTISSKRDNKEEIDRHDFIEGRFNTEDDARTAAGLGARAWIDAQDANDDVPV